MRKRVLTLLVLAPAALAQEQPAPTDDTSRWIHSNLPGWLKDTGWLLANWQWFGLLVLALVGVIGGAVVRYAVIVIGRRVARARGAEMEETKSRGRPFSLAGQGLIWALLLPFLRLPQTWHDALLFAAHGVAMVGIVWSACRIVDWVAELFTRLAERTETGLDDLIVPMVRKALKVVIVALGVVWIADNLGMNVAALLAGVSLGGFAVALASKDMIENLFGAAAILADRPFQVGDWIKMGDIEGTVEQVGFRTTRVRTFYNSLITFPNAMLIRGSVDNLGARRYRRIKQTLGVTYDTPPDKLEAFVEGVREIIRRHPYTRKDYYHVYFTGFGDSALEILLYAFVKTPDWATELREKQRLMLDILRLARRLGVEFAFPTRTLHMISSNMPEHGEPVAVQRAQREGRQHAKEIVDAFTGHERPPPVEIGDRPDDSLDDDGGDG